MFSSVLLAVKLRFFMVALDLPVTAEKIRPRWRTTNGRSDLIASDFLRLGVAATSRRASKTLGLVESRDGRSCPEFLFLRF